MTKAELAEKNFHDGLNCAQAVACAFEEELQMERETVLALTQPFGGGMGRLRETCGAFSGMLFVAGKLLYRGDDAKSKAEMYAFVQKVGKTFSAKFGSLNCGELLSGVAHNDAPVAEARTGEYYKKRPCGELVRSAAEILENALAERNR